MKDEYIIINKTTIQLKVASDNTITIKKLKEKTSWSREEIEELFY